MIEGLRDYHEIDIINIIFMVIMQSFNQGSKFRLFR